MSRSSSDNHSSRNTSSDKPSLRQRMSQDLQLLGMAKRTHDGYFREVRKPANRVLVLSAWLHYALGNTLSQIVDVFNFHMQLKLTPGGLVQMWYRLQGILYPWYQQIQKEALKSVHPGISWVR